MSTMGDQRPEVFVMPVAATQFFQFEIFLRQSRLPKPQEDQLANLIGRRKTASELRLATFGL